MPFPRGKGAGLPSQAACVERLPPPFFRVAGPKSSFFIRKERRGDSLLKASSLVPLSPAPPLPVAGAWGQLRAGFPLPVSRVPEALPHPPCCGRVRAPGVGGAELRSPFRSGSGVCMGESSFHDATGRRGTGGGRTVGEPSPPTLDRPPCPKRHSVITGKENYFKKLPCRLIYLSGPSTPTRTPLLPQTRESKIPVPTRVPQCPEDPDPRPDYEVSGSTFI